MINYFSEIITNFFINNSIISSEEKNIYKYGAEITISSLLGILIIILISVILGKIQDGILFLLCFIPIRIYTGGYHMDTYLKCNVTFISVFFIILFLSYNIPKQFEFQIGIICLIISLIIISILSPIENKNKPLDHKEIKKYKKIGIFVSFLWSLIAIILFQFNINIFLLVSLTMLIIAILMIVEKIKNYKNKKGVAL